MAFTFDGPNRLISVDTPPVSGEMSFTVIDMYSAWKDWFRLSDNSKFLPAFRTSGGDANSIDESVGLYYFFINGWRFKLYGANHFLTVIGNIRVSTTTGEDIGGSAFVPPAGYNTHVETQFSVESIIKYVSSGSVLTTEEHNKLVSIPSETLTAAQADQLDSIQADVEQILTEGPGGGVTPPTNETVECLATVTFEQPLDIEGEIVLKLIRGDTYSSIESKAIVFTVPDVVSLEGASVMMHIKNKLVPSRAFAVPCTVDDAGEPTQLVNVELTSEQTNWEEGNYFYSVKATLENGHIITLIHSQTLNVV